MADSDAAATAAVSEPSYRALLELLPDAVLVHEGRRIVFANRSAAAMLGANDPSELLGHSPLDFLDPADAHLAVARIEHLERNGGSVPLLEERYRRLDGEIIDVEVAAAAFTFENRPAIEYIVRDIGQRKAADRAMRESESRIRAIFDESSIGMLLLDPAGRCVSSNRALQRLLGYSEAELASMSIRDITYPEDVGLTGVALREFFAGRPWPGCRRSAFGSPSTTSARGTRHWPTWPGIRSTSSR